MDLVSRLILSLILLLACGQASAFGPVAKKPSPVYQCITSVGGTGPLACNAALAALPTTCATDWPGDVCIYKNSITSCDATSCLFHVETWYTSAKYGGGSRMSGSMDKRNSFSLLRTDYLCPEFSTLVGSGSASACECNEGYKSVNGQCVPYTCPAAGNYTAVTTPDLEVPNAGDGICSGGCGYTPSSWKASQDGKIWGTWPFKSTGKACGGSKGADSVATGEQNTSKPAPIPCGANQCPGTVTMNGATTQMCVACKGTSAAPATETASAPAGSASGAGEVTTKTQTTCDGITCTTTKTTTDSTGTVVASTQKKEDQASFCTQNPNSPLCKKSSFGGSCAATSCDGDAVQCALAQEVIKRNCQWYDDANVTKPQQDVGTAAMAAGDRPDWHPGAAANVASVDFSGGSRWDQTDRLGGGGCSVMDESIVVMGQAVTLPFSKTCSVFDWLGSLFVGISMLAAAFITFRS